VHLPPRWELLRFALFVIISPLGTACGKIGDLSFAWVYQVTNTLAHSLCVPRKAGVTCGSFLYILEQITHFERRVFVPLIWRCSFFAVIIIIRRVETFENGFILLSARVETIRSPEK